MTNFLYGPYSPPGLREGDRAYCLYRRYEVVVSGWSKAPLPWPLGRASGRGHPSPVVDAELARAVRSEHPDVLCHWLGVSPSLVRSWKLALGVPRSPRRWLTEHLALLGTMPDEEVARRTGRTLNGVRIVRHKRGIPTFQEGLRLPPGTPPEVLARALRLDELAHRVSEERVRWLGLPGRREGSAVFDALGDALAALEKAREAVEQGGGRESLSGRHPRRAPEDRIEG